MVVSPETTYNVIVEAEGYHTYTGEIFFDAIVGFGSQIEEFKLIPINEYDASNQKTHIAVFGCTVCVVDTGTGFSVFSVLCCAIVY